MTPVDVRSPWRLFVAFAALCLVPVVLLGLGLASSYRHEASRRGLAEGRAEASLFARTGVEPILAGVDLDQQLPTDVEQRLDQMARTAVSSKEISRVRIRSLTGQVVWANDQSRAANEDDEALEAAEGRTVSEVTRIDADEVGDGEPAGVRVAEVYRPLTNGQTSRPVGVLELYLPYEPIVEDIGRGLRTLYLDLALGLSALYLLLAGISWTATRRLRSAVAQNAHLAEHDQLTGLPNRAMFQRQVDAAASSADPAVVAVLDLDRFKEVNDTMGHGFGDALLVDVAERLRHAVGGEGVVVARLGGDEFGVLFNAFDEEQRAARERAIVEAVNAQTTLNDLPFLVQAAIGSARAPQDGATAEALLQHADVAMYVAKESGTPLARYVAVTDRYDADRLALVGEMGRALRENELVLHFQPKINLRTGAVEAAEALVRWEHPVHGLLAPDRFLPVVEQTQMIDPLTDWVLDHALAWVAAAPAATGLKVAVNVSARNLHHADFASRVLAAVAAHDLANDRLTVEVTETALVTDLSRVLESLRQLATAGVGVSIDDFGQGQTSLSQLSTTPVRELKIDRSFVVDLDESEPHRAIVRSVIDLAHNLGMEVVAEGAETELVLDLLRTMGCDVVQGYVISRPLSPVQFERWRGGRHRHPDAAFDTV